MKEILQRYFKTSMKLLLALMIFGIAIAFVNNLENKGSFETLFHSNYTNVFLYVCGMAFMFSLLESVIKCVNEVKNNKLNLKSLLKYVLALYLCYSTLFIAVASILSTLFSFLTSMLFESKFGKNELFGTIFSSNFEITLKAFYGFGLIFTPALILGYLLLYMDILYKSIKK